VNVRRLEENLQIEALDLPRSQQIINYATRILALEHDLREARSEIERLYLCLALRRRTVDL
jgi:hypothetical protein